MKKIIVCLLCVGLLFGCSGKKNSPTNAVQTYLKDTQTKIETASQEIVNEYLGANNFAPPADMIKKLSDFSYKINKETIEGETAKVEITFTTYNFGEAFQVVFPSVFAYVLNESLSGKDKDAVNQEASNMMIEAFSKAEKDYTETLILSLHQDENKAWVLDDETSLENVYSGNLKNTIKDFNSSLNPGLTQ